MQKDEYRVYEPLKPISQPPKPLSKELQEIKGKYPTNQIQEVKGYTEGTEEYHFSEVERKQINERRKRIDTKDTYLIIMPRSLKQRIKELADTRCRFMSAMIVEALSQWVDEEERTERNYRGD